MTWLIQISFLFFERERERIYPLLVGEGGEKGPTTFLGPHKWSALWGCPFFNEDPKILTHYPSTLFSLLYSLLSTLYSLLSTTTTYFPLSPYLHITIILKPLIESLPSILPPWICF